MHRELYEYRVEIDGGNAINVSKNPGPAMLMFFVGTCRRGIARGALIGQDVYFWDAMLATHEDIQTYFGAPVDNSGFDVAEVVDGEAYRFACQEEFLNKLIAHPSVRRCIYDQRIVIAREDGTEESIIDMERSSRP